MRFRAMRWPHSLAQLGRPHWGLLRRSRLEWVVCTGLREKRRGRAGSSPCPWPKPSTPATVLCALLPEMCAIFFSLVPDPCVCVCAPIIFVAPCATAALCIRMRWPFWWWFSAAHGMGSSPRARWCVTLPERPAPPDSVPSSAKWGSRNIILHSFRAHSLCAFLGAVGVVLFFLLVSSSHLLFKAF